MPLGATDFHAGRKVGKYEILTLLSMGGMATLSVGIPNLDKFGYFGVFSAGLSERGTQEMVESNRAMLDNPDIKAGIRLFFVRCGEADFLLRNSRQTVESLEKLGIQLDAKETPGGHTWENWRKYLSEFAPKLFR